VFEEEEEEEGDGDDDAAAAEATVEADVEVAAAAAALMMSAACGFFFTPLASSYSFSLRVGFRSFKDGRISLTFSATP
jgi:hypothetical protein